MRNTPSDALVKVQLFALVYRGSHLCVGKSVSKAQELGLCLLSFYVSIYMVWTFGTDSFNDERATRLDL